MSDPSLGLGDDDDNDSVETNKKIDGLDGESSKDTTSTLRQETVANLTSDSPKEPLPGNAQDDTTEIITPRTNSEGDTATGRSNIHTKHKGRSHF